MSLFKFWVFCFFPSFLSFCYASILKKKRNTSLFVICHVHIIQFLSTYWSVQRKSCSRKLLKCSLSVCFLDSLHTFLVARTYRSGCNPPVLKIRQMKCGLLSWGEIHLPHWLSLLMARERKKMEEEVVCGRTRGAQQACCSQGGRAWERQPPEQSRFCYTERTDSKETGLCPLHFQSQEFQGEKCLLVIHSARNNTQSSSGPLWNRGGWWRLQCVLTHSNTERTVSVQQPLAWTSTRSCWPLRPTGKWSQCGTAVNVIVSPCLIIFFVKRGQPLGRSAGWLRRRLRKYLLHLQRVGHPILPPNKAQLIYICSISKWCWITVFSVSEATRWFLWGWCHTLI